MDNSKLMKHLSKNALTLPIGSKEQAQAFGELLKLQQQENQEKNDLEKTSLDREKFEFEKNKLKEETRIKEKQLALDEDKFRVEHSLNEAKFTQSQFESNTNIALEKKKGKLEIVKLIIPVAGSIAATAFSMSCFNATLNKCFAFEQNGVITSAGTKMAIGLFKPKL